MSVPILQVDAFTGEAFRGNPAAVALLPTMPAREWMQAVAAEMNLSETAFLARRGADHGDWDLKWFTPTQEVELCGHATLASAHALWERRDEPQESPIRFHTKSGVLTARMVTDAMGATGVELDFPAKAWRAISTDDDVVRRAAEALRVPLARVVGAAEADWLLMIEVDSEALVREMRPDFAGVAALDAFGVVATCRGERSDADFVSRVFVPRKGIPEDPVTGSAHCALAPYWADKLGRDDLIGYQASARGGLVGCGVRGDRVFLRGRAVTVFRGELTPATMGAAQLRKG